MKKKIRVIHLIHQLGTGGAENGIINLLNNIDQKYFTVSVCAFVAGGLFVNRQQQNNIKKL